MNGFNRKGLVLIAGAGALVVALAAILVAQDVSKPVKSETQYFVTGDGDHAHLWVREGATLRVVAHGECKDCPVAKDTHDH